MKNYHQLVSEVLELPENIHKKRVDELFEQIECTLRDAILTGQTYLTIDINKKDMPGYIRLYIINHIMDVGWIFYIINEDENTISIRFFLGYNK